MKTITLDAEIRAELDEFIRNCELTKEEAAAAIAAAKELPAKITTAAADPAARDKLAAEIRAAVADEYAEVEQINGELQRKLAAADKSAEAARAEAARAVEYKSKFEAVNGELRTAREEAAAAIAAAEAARAAQIAAETAVKPREAIREVPPFDYEDIKAALCDMEAILAGVRAELVAVAADKQEYARRAETAAAQLHTAREELSAARESARLQSEYSIPASEYVRKLEAEMEAARARIAELEALLHTAVVVTSPPAPGIRVGCARCNQIREEINEKLRAA